MCPYFVVLFSFAASLFPLRHERLRFEANVHATNAEDGE